MLAIMTLDDLLLKYLFSSSSDTERQIIVIFVASFFAAIISHFLALNYEKYLKITQKEAAARRYAEEELGETLSILQATLESTADGILVISRERNVVTYNKKFLEQWNIPPEVADSKNDKKLLDHVLSQLKNPDEFINKVEELYHSPEETSFDIIEFKDGRVFERYSQPHRLGKNIMGRVWSFGDITEKKKDEKRIKDSEERFKAIWKYSRDGFRLTDEEGLVLLVNDAYLKFFDKKEDEVVNKPFYIHYPLSEHALGLDKYKQRFAEQKSEEAVLSNLKFDNGREAWVEITNSFVEIQNKTYLLSIFRDFTHHKEVEEKITLSEKKFRALFENGTDAIFLMNGDAFTDCNKKAEQMFNASREEILKLKPYDISPKFQPDGIESKEKALDKIQTALDGGQQVFEWKHKKLTGELFDCEVTLTKIELEGKNYIQAIVRDVSDRKHSEKLQEAIFSITVAASSATDLAALYRTIHESIKTLMPAINFYIALYDEAKNEISFPYFVDEFDEMPAPRPPRRGLTEYVLRTKSPLLATSENLKVLEQKEEIEVIGTDSIDWLGVPLYTEEKIIGVLVVQSYSSYTRYTEKEQDILVFVSSQVAMAIYKKKTSEELAASELQLKELNASKDKFFSIIAHDLRSPFHALLGLSELLATELDDLSKDEIKKFALELNISLKNQHKLLENLLAWSQLQTGKMQYAPVHISLNDFVNDVIALLAGNALKKNITVVNRVSSRTTLFADANMLQSIIQNLLSNAIKFTRAGGNIFISEKANGNRFVRVSVQDTGVGISKENLDKIFRTDSTATTKGTDNEKGTGLGLLLCKEMIERHGGALTVESELEKGTTFSFTMPQN